MNWPNLKPCPFCGGTDIQPEVLFSIGLYWIECWECGATSGNGKDDDEAIGKWNMREK